MRTFPTLRNSSRGAALVIALLVALIVAGIGTAMIALSNSEQWATAGERNMQKALFASKSGLNYGYYLFRENLLEPTAAGASFDSTADLVGSGLAGASFSGTLSDLSGSLSQGQIYRIQSTGGSHTVSKTSELLLQFVPEVFQYGFVGFNDVGFYNRANMATYTIPGTVFSNHQTIIAKNMTLDGTIVSGGDVTTENGSVVKGSIYANSLTNRSTVTGRARMLSAVIRLAATALSWDRRDDFRNKYSWHNQLPGSVDNYGTISSGVDSYMISDGAEFVANVFAADGQLSPYAVPNVIKVLRPPLLDYAAMKAEADRFDPTYFTTMAGAMSYLASKRVTENIAGKTVTTIKVGSAANPEFLYVVGGLNLRLDPGAVADDYTNGILRAHGLHLEGGIYTSGDFQFHGPAYNTITYPSGYLQLKINALDYCYPAIVVYQQPTVGTIANWRPSDTPAMNGLGSRIVLESTSSPNEGFVSINGLTYSQQETHLHHTKTTVEEIRFNGAELGWTLQNCDSLSFTYDPGVRCTRFLVSREGSPAVISYRELP